MLYWPYGSIIQNWPIESTSLLLVGAVGERLHLLQVKKELPKWIWNVYFFATEVFWLLMLAHLVLRRATPAEYLLVLSFLAIGVIFSSVASHLINSQESDT